MLFSDGILSHGPSTVMSRWLQRSIHGDMYKAFPQALSLFSTVFDARHCRATDVKQFCTFCFHVTHATLTVM